MAYLTEMFCPGCRQNVSVCVSGGNYPSLCNNCQQLKENEEWRKELDKLRQLTLEERIENLEKQFYDLLKGQPWNNSNIIG